MFIGRLSNRATESDVERFFEGFGKILEVNLKTGYGFVEFEDSRDADDAVYELNNQNLCGERVTVEIAKGVRRTRESYGGGGGGGGRYGGGGGGRYGGGGGGYRGGGGGYNGNRYGGGRDYGNRGYGGRDDRYGDGGRSRRYPPPASTKYRVIVENLSSRCSWQDLKDFMRQGGEVSYAEAHQKNRNEGIVDFISYDDMKSAIEKLDNSELNGRKIRMVEENTRSTSRSRSRSGSRSRSRSRDNRSLSRSKSPGYQD